MTAVTQIMSKGKVQAEELRGQLGDRLPGAFNIMARALGVTTAELDDMMKKGEVLSDEALPKFAAELRRTFGTDAATRIDTTTSSFSRLWNEIKGLAGDVGGQLNPVLGTTAERLASILRYARENPGTATGYFLSGQLAGFTQLTGAGGIDALGAAAKLAEERRRMIGSWSPESPDLSLEGLMRPQPQFVGPAGFSSQQQYPEPLVAARGNAVDTDATERLRRELALLTTKTELEKTDWDIQHGKLRDASAYEQSLARQLAIAKDKVAADKEAARDAKADAKEAAREAKRLAEERLRDYKDDLQSRVKAEQDEMKAIRAQQERNVLLEYELRTGTKITGESQKQLLLMQAKYGLYAETTLEAERQKGADLEWTQALFDDLDRISSQSRRTTSEMSEFTKRAAQNMQDAFAQFLFDPFHDGLAGMLEGFTRTMQQMLAQQVAANTFDAFGGVSGISNFLLGMMGGGQPNVGEVDFAAQDPFGPVQFKARGGAIVGRGGPTEDKVPIWASNGEYMLNAKTTRRLGKAYLDAVNFNGMTPRFATGGAIGGAAPTYGGSIVEIHNYTGAEAREERGTTPDGRELVRIVIGAMQHDVVSNGPFSRTMQQAYNLRYQPNGRGG